MAREKFKLKEHWKKASIWALPVAAVVLFVQRLIQYWIELPGKIMQDVYINGGEAYIPFFYEEALWLLAGMGVVVAIILFIALRKRVNEKKVKTYYQKFSYLGLIVLISAVIVYFLELVLGSGIEINRISLFPLALTPIILLLEKWFKKKKKK